jgi:hypothetical protein
VVGEMMTNELSTTLEDTATSSMSGLDKVEGSKTSSLGGEGVSTSVSESVKVNVTESTSQRKDYSLSDTKESTPKSTPRFVYSHSLNSR